jgi:hypothetical protein
MWLDERTNRSTNLPAFTTCCAKGKVMLPLLQEFPFPLNSLLIESDPRSRLFRKIFDHIIQHYHLHQ